jgi:ADP-heptose:LPS heptosyltransferase
MRDLPGCDFWRFQRVRHTKRCIEDAADVAVLSRITLGADVAVTSVILDCVKRRFPGAHIWFVGPRKNYELFEEDSRIEHFDFNYPRRGSLRERIEAARSLRLPDEALVVDPDSRITQLGLVPVCLERNYFFFESRSYGEETADPMSVLTARWCREVFGLESCRAYVAPRRMLEGADAAVSLGTGGNSRKGLSAAFERDLLDRLAKSGSVLIDKGAGGEEAERVERAIQGLNVRVWSGSFAAFASAILDSGHYYGYDSSGQHVAAAAGIPLTVYFTGAISDRFRHRWRPYGSGPITVIDSI